jgi:hypothetical protein
LNSRQKFENILGHEYKEPGDVVWWQKMKIENLMTQCL